MTQLAVELHRGTAVRRSRCCTGKTKPRRLGRRRVFGAGEHVGVGGSPDTRSRLEQKTEKEREHLSCKEPNTRSYRQS